MTGWTEILVVAFLAQLAVLPGEKVQFIIAGLSTRFNPAVVVGAAGTAFAGWTAVELLFGQAVQRVLPGVYLDLITAGLFLLFAVLLVRSAPEVGAPAAPETDGGHVAARLPEFPALDADLTERFGGFVPIFALMAAGEFGDKTQLVTIGLAVQYGAHPAIWTGEMLAIIPVSVLNALFFHRFSHRFDVRKAHLVGAALFAFFGLDTLLSVAVGVSVWETAVGAASAALLGLV